MRTRCSAGLRIHQISQCANHRRHFSTVTTSTVETVSIARPGAESLPILVHKPLLASKEEGSAVLYFPRDAQHKNGRADDEVIKILRSTLPCHIIQVQYRQDRRNQHPSAIYDSVAAYDWVVEHILPLRSGRWSYKTNHRGRIATCGEYLGGSLATMLALTECRAGEPGVVAAAINNAVLDWTDLNPQTRRKTTRIEAPSKLITTRDEVFKKPVHYFDPLASPLLLFRSPGCSPPVQVEDNDEAFFDHDEYQPAVAPEVTKAPRSSRQFPSKAHNLTLPAFHITSGRASLLSLQAEEFSKQLKRSILRQRKGRAGIRSRWIEDSFYDHDPMDVLTSGEEAALAEVDEQVQSESIEGTASWSTEPAGVAMIHSMANWLREQLMKSPR